MGACTSIDIIVQHSNSRAVLQLADQDYRSQQRIAWSYDPRPIFSDLEPQERLYSGNLSVVKLYQNVSHGGRFIVLKSYPANLKGAVAAAKELGILMSLQKAGCPFIPDCHGGLLSREQAHIVMEYCPGGPLASHFPRISKKPLPAELSKFLLVEIACSLEAMHSVGILYRQLCWNHVLFDTQGHLRLVDFSDCVRLGVSGGLAGEAALLAAPVLEPPIYYAAPKVESGEKYQSQGDHDTSTDWWSFGAMACDMLTGHTPFGPMDTGDSVLRGRLARGEFRWPAGMKAAQRELVRACMNPNQRQRPKSIVDIQSLAFFAEVDWEKASRGQLQPPFVPRVTHPADTSHFPSPRDPLSLARGALRSSEKARQLRRGSIVVEQVLGAGVEQVLGAGVSSSKDATLSALAAADFVGTVNKSSQRAESLQLAASGGTDPSGGAALGPASGMGTGAQFLQQSPGSQVQGTANGGWAKGGTGRRKAPKAARRSLLAEVTRAAGDMEESERDRVSRILRGFY